MNKNFKRMFSFLLSFALLLQVSFPSLLADTVINGTSNDNNSNNQTVSNSVYYTAVNLQMFNSNTVNQSNIISPNFKITNTGTKVINLKDVKIRYYYFYDESKSQNFYCDYSNVGNQNITGTFVKMQNPQINADNYCEIGFNDLAGTLEPGKYVEIHTRIAKEDWSNYNQTDDYSFNKFDANYVDNKNVTVNVGDNLIWGTVPTGNPYVKQLTQAVKLQMYNGNTVDQSNTLFPRFKLINTGNLPINLADVKVRYYYTIDGDKEQNYWCDYSNVGNQNITGTFVKIADGLKQNANCYFEMGFNQNAGTLEPGKSVEAHIRIAKTDWSNYDQSNDYSFTNVQNDYADWDKADVYIGGKLYIGQGLEGSSQPKYIYTEYSKYFLECDKEQTVNFSVYDDSGKAVPKTECKIMVDGSATVDSSVVTDENGIGTIKITDKTEEDVTLNIETSNGVKISVPISFKKAALLPEYIYTEYPEYYFECDQDQTVNFCVYDDSDNGVSKEKCKVTVSGSAVADSSVVTDKDGMGIIKITDNTEEDVTLTIETSNGIKTEIPISFVKPIPPAKPEVKLIKENGVIVLTWENVKDADYYEVRRKTDNGEYVKVGEYVEDNFYVDGDIESGNKYSYIVDAVNSFGTSGDPNEVSTEYTAPMDNLGKLTADKATVFTNEATPVTFHITLQNKIADTDGIKLIDADSNDKKVIAIMYDDGNADNGDVAKGDKIYSCKININETENKNLHLKAYANINIDDSMQDIYSENAFELKVVSKFTQEELTDTQEALSDITTNYKEFIKESNNDLDVLSQKTLEYVKSNSYVAGAGISEGTHNVWYLLKSGIKCVIPIAEDGTNGTGSATTISYDYSNSKSTYSTYETIANDFSKSGYNSSLLEDQSVSLSSFKSLGSNTAILINCHGGLYQAEPYICSSDVAYLDNIILHNEDLSAGRLTVVVTQYGSYFGVLPEYIRTYNTSLNDSVVFLGSCQGLANNDMAQAFTDLGAKAVFGFDNEVYKDYASGCAKVIFQSILDDGQTAGEAYNNVQAIMKDSDNTWKGANTKPAAHLKLYGDSESTLANDRNKGDLVNGDFENGFTGWTTSGNASIVSEYQDIKPTSGNNMAMLSDSASSFIEQRIYVPVDATTVSFDCYGICQNPVMLSICHTSQDGIEFEPVNDDGGSISDTGYYSWHNIINVHNYQGRYLTLRFYVPKNSDDEGDTSRNLIIDNVSINGTPSQLGNDNESTDYDDKEYLTWPTVSTNIINHNSNESNNSHIGIDIQGSQGDEVCAACNGEVVFAGNEQGVGNVVIINSEYAGKKIQTRYTNLQSLSVETGDYVFEGDLLGSIGAIDNYPEGAAILHFEVLESKDGNECSIDKSNTTNKDPEDYLFPYSQIEGVVPDVNLDTMGNNNNKSEGSSEYIYVDTLQKTYGKWINITYDNNKDITKAKTVTIKMLQHSPKEYKNGLVPFLVIKNYTDHYKYNVAQVINGKMAINADAFMHIFYPSIYNNSFALAYPKGGIDPKPNEVNAYIYSVQRKLNSINKNYNLRLTGVYDDNTKKAICDFKKKKGIISKGKNGQLIDKATWERLFTCSKLYKSTAFKQWYIPDVPTFGGNSDLDKYMTAMLNSVNSKINISAEHYYNCAISQHDKYGNNYLPEKYKKMTRDKAIIEIRKDLVWNQDKVKKVWNECKKMSIEKGVIIDPRILIAIIYAEGTGSFDTNVHPTNIDANGNGDGQGGIQPDFKTDLSDAFNNFIMGKIWAYSHCADKYMKAAEDHKHQGIYKEIGDMFEYINYYTIQIKYNNEKHLYESYPGVYATDRTWYRIIRGKFNELDGYQFASIEYSKYLAKYPIPYPKNYSLPEDLKFDVTEYADKNNTLDVVNLK